ncbi:pseudouridine-5'-phosphate glycosidase [Candidatus Leptofilum sp.]|uniref:pseudouridine-5'-phosphate glycosidase n=1 Tax=Candidatus Leptofilum sp. TaxID=3241576 RepID=UPI003B59D7C8
MNPHLQLHPEVQAALAENRAVVVMESTLISHGLPHPQNVEAAVQMETAVRQAGATPATVAIIQGKICVGLSEDQLEYVATRPAGTIYRCNRRNLPLVVARQEDGATTVAGTMIVAHLAGIEMFATGGIGGVHRHHPFDVSSDLTELGRTPVTVVSSGAKPFLDLPATGEVLETQGVLTVGVGTDDLAPFFSQPSGQSTDIRLDDLAEVANLIQTRRGLGLQSGTLVAVSVPDEHRYEYEVINETIKKAVREQDAQGIRGTAVTSWMVRHLVQAIGPDALYANILLLCNNATIAAQIGVKLAESRQ